MKTKENNIDQPCVIGGIVAQDLAALTYCNKGAELYDVGNTLLRHYRSNEKIRDLILAGRIGGITCLKPTIEETEFFSSDEPLHHFEYHEPLKLRQYFAEMCCDELIKAAYWHDSSDWYFWDTFTHWNMVLYENRDLKDKKIIGKKIVLPNNYWGFALKDKDPRFLPRHTDWQKLSDLPSNLFYDKEV